MSRWTYLSSVITVDVPGRTQPEIDDLILITIGRLDGHLM